MRKWRKTGKKTKKKLGRGWVSNQGPRIFSFRRLQTLKSDSVIFISLARISSDNAHIYTHSYFIYAQRPLKFSGRTFIFTARNTRKTENLLFVFWSCPSSAQKYLLFQFSDARFEILSIFCPWYKEKMILKKKGFGNRKLFQFSVHVWTSPLRGNPQSTCGHFQLGKGRSLACHKSWDMLLVLWEKRVYLLALPSRTF